MKEPIHLSEDQIDQIAERACEKAFAKIYQEIGQSIVKKGLFVLGATALACLAWLAGTNNLK